MIIKLHTGLELNDDDIQAIAHAIRSTLPKPPSEDLTMEEAALELGLSCSTKASLSSAFSRLGSDKYFKYPLRSNRIGAERFFKREAVAEFKRRGKDNKVKK
jgi:hypothetical protein